jgi:16S rRNA (cytosine1402-N4)-methyltransferase
MVSEVVDFLRPVFGRGTLVDGTVGGGGHTLALLRASAEAGVRTPVLAIDADRDAVGAAGERLSAAGFRTCEVEPDRGAGVRADAYLVQTSYVEMHGLAERLGLEPVTGVLLDLGVSLHQLRTPGRGFGYDVSGPLDMRFDARPGVPTAVQLLRRASERTIREWLRDFADEPRSARLARLLRQHRSELETTDDLARLVRHVARGPQAGRVLARVFQALRIATNGELDAVRAGVEAGAGTLSPDGRLVVLSYHSGEDRIVKNVMRGGRAQGRLEVLTRKPVRPSTEEARVNPCSRSAKLRAARKAA